MTKFSIVCLSSQDWRVDLPTNRQQIMRRAAREGHQVLFVESGHFIGKHLWRLLRRPGRRSLARRLFATEAAETRVQVRKDMSVLPWGTRYRSAGWVNAWLTSVAVNRLIRRLPKPVVLWIYHPLAIQLAGRCHEALVVYDCVDDYAEQTRDERQRRLVAQADEQAGRDAGLVFATTSTLFDRQRARNPHAHLVANVADYDHFAPAANRSISAPEVSDLPRPVIGFTGNFMGSKVDFELLDRLATLRPEWTLLLVGPVDSDSREAMRRLGARGNVLWLGPRPYSQLPRYVAAFDVGVIPYVSNAYTRSCFPLKLYEYLAAGKPVVASGLPELVGREPDVIVADGVDSFAAAVQSALRLTAPEDRARRQTLASQNTWETRTSRLLSLVAGELRADDDPCYSPSAMYARPSDLPERNG